MYVTRRRNRVLRKTNQVPLDPAKSNPSKRHRERLNGELEYLASLLPFEESVIAKLDKLSVLRLAVSYLRAKSYYRAIAPVHHPAYPTIESDADTQLKALNGFVMVIDPNSEVFYVSETVEQYLGFHQSDILHQSVLELVHSEDRESLSQQLNWSNLLMHLGPNPSHTDVNNLHAHQASHQLLQRSFIVRFRCLLDNTSGFITMEICGHLKPLYGQTAGMNGLSLFAVCTPFGPVPMGDFNLEDITFRSKHKLDMSIVSVDPRGKLLLGDLENSNTKIYNLLHPMDVHYFADSHKEMLKTGSSGLVAYRLMGKEGNWLWLQTSARVVYRNSKPDYLMCFHRNLTEEEGSNLIGKRNIEFAMPQLHADTLMDEGDYIEDLPRTPKVRKTKKTPQAAPTQMIQTEVPIVPYDMPPTLYDKDPSSMYYSLQGFPSAAAMHQYKYTPQFYDAYHGFSMDSHYARQSYYQNIDHLPYAANPTLQASVMAMDADRLAAAMIHPPNTSHTYADSLSKTAAAQVSTYNHLSSPDVISPISTNSQMYPVPTPAHCMQGYTTPANGFFETTDINSNPLLSFREMTYPLLNQ